MMIELLSFFGGTLLILLPGICLARRLQLGNNFLECCTYGSSLGLALAVYIACAISHFDLRWFYPIWAVLGLFFLSQVITARDLPTTDPDHWTQFLMGILLLAVGLSRYYPALPRLMPGGAFDPTFHTVLARKIQLTHHAVFDWLPIAPVKLNYPTGSHTLIAVVSGLTHLPVHTVFKDFVPLLGVLTTAQIYVLARRITSSFVPAFYSAIVYGFWAWYGSLDYFRWGGLPNELAMLLFIAMLSLWLDRVPRFVTLFCMTVFYAATILVHHHVMVVSGLILASIVTVELIREPRSVSWKMLISATLLGAFADAFFLVPYAARITTLHSTGISSEGEHLLPLLSLPGEMGYGVLIAASIGIILYVKRKVSCHRLLPVAAVVLLALFLICEDVIPIVEQSIGREPFRVFTPSRFLADLNYFLPVFAGLALAHLHKFKIRGWVVALITILTPVLSFSQWKEIAGEADLPIEFIRACDWIQHNTSPDTIVDSDSNWITYLSWRRSSITPLPVSEPLADVVPQQYRIPRIMSGEIPPDSPQMKIVAIKTGGPYSDKSVLWISPGGWAVIQEWPPFAP